MKEEIVSLETSKLAKEKGFDWNGEYMAFTSIHTEKYPEGEIFLKPTQSLLQKFIRETRGVHIEIHRNASGYYWSMCMSDGGTDLGWSDSSGPNLGGVWDSFEDALENALKIQLSYDLPNDTEVIKHWVNYVEFALKK